MPRPNPPRKRPRRRPSAARADAELTRQTAQSTRPQQPGSKPPSGGSGGRGGGAATAVISPDEMWSRRSYAILVALMAGIESVISLFLLAIYPGSKDPSDVVVAAIGLNGYQPITLAAASLLAAPIAQRITGESRKLRFVETIVVALSAYLIFTVLGIAIGILVSTGTSSPSPGAPATPLPNTSSTPTTSAQPSASASATASSGPSATPSASPSASATPSPSAAPSASASPGATTGSAGNARSFKVNVPSAISVGQPFSVVVKAATTSGGSAQGFTHSVRLTSSDGSAALPSPYTFATGDSGQHTFQATLNTTGSQTITVTDDSDGSISGKSSGITVAGPAAKLLLVPSSPIAAGQQGSVRVTVQDKSGRRVTDYDGTVRFSSTDAQAKLPGDYTFTTGDCGSGVSSQPDCGQRTFNNLTFSNSGTQTVSAKDINDSSIVGTSASVTVSLPLPVVIAADAVVLALSYVATVFVYPPLYKRLRAKPRPPADPKKVGGGGRR